jgi:hypothetical protein
MHALHASLSPALRLVVALLKAWRRTERLPSPCLSRRFTPMGTTVAGWEELCRRPGVTDLPVSL